MQNHYQCKNSVNFIVLIMSLWNHLSKTHNTTSTLEIFVWFYSLTNEVQRTNFSSLAADFSVVPSKPNNEIKQRASCREFADRCENIFCSCAHYRPRCLTTVLFLLSRRMSSGLSSGRSKHDWLQRWQLWSNISSITISALEIWYLLADVIKQSAVNWAAASMCDLTSSCVQSANRSEIQPRWRKKSCNDIEREWSLVKFPTRTVKCMYVDWHAVQTTQFELVSRFPIHMSDAFRLNWILNFYHINSWNVHQSVSWRFFSRWQCSDVSYTQWEDTSERFCLLWF